MRLKLNRGNQIGISAARFSGCSGNAGWRRLEFLSNGGFCFDLERLRRYLDLSWSGDIDFLRPVNPDPFRQGDFDPFRSVDLDFLQRVVERTRLRSFDLDRFLETLRDFLLERDCRSRECDLRLQDQKHREHREERDRLRFLVDFERDLRFLTDLDFFLFIDLDLDLLRLWDRLRLRLDHFKERDRLSFVKDLSLDSDLDLHLSSIVSFLISTCSTLISLCSTLIIKLSSLTLTSMSLSKSLAE